MYNKNNVFERDKNKPHITHIEHYENKNLTVHVFKTIRPIPITNTSFNNFQGFLESSQFIIAFHSLNMSSFLQCMNNF